MAKEENKEELAQLLIVLSGKANEFKTAVDEIVKSELDAFAADPNYCHNDVKKVIFRFNNYKVIATVNTTGPVDVTFDLYFDERIIVSAKKAVFDFGLDDKFVFRSLPGTPYWKFIGNIAALLNDISAVNGNQDLFKELIAKREYVNKETLELINRSLAERKLFDEKEVEIAEGIHLNINVSLSLNFDINIIDINYSLSNSDNIKSAEGIEEYSFFKLSYDYSEQEVLDCADEVFSDMLGHFVCDNYYV